MGIEYLYDDGFPATKGVRPYSEDGVIFCPGIGWDCVLGVLDGVSFYHPALGHTLFDGITQGQLAVRLTSRAFLSAKLGEPLAKTLMTANNLIRRESEKYGLSLEEPEFLPGTDFVLMSGSFSENVISIVWGGDCGAVWQMKDGSRGGTVNVAYDYELWVEQTFAAIKEKHGGGLNGDWEEWLPLRMEKIRQLQNKPGGWSTISGQPEFENSWREVKLPGEEVSLVILFTDGFVRFEDTKDPLALAQKLIPLYLKGGLAEILTDTRLSQIMHLPRSHEATCPEATAIAIRLAV